ncbi:MAG: right-handed parallel beta-helix repeat-containing protein [Pseudomonadota bacterium]
MQLTLLKRLIAGAGFVVSAPAFCCDVFVSPGSSIQAAINSSAPYDVVCLQPGVHNVSQTINLIAQTTIKGNSSNKANVSVNASSSLVGPVFRATSRSGSMRSHTFEGFTIRNNGSSQSNSRASAIDLKDTEYSTITDMNLFNTWRMSVIVQDSYNVFVSNSSFKDMGFAPQAQGAFWINQSDRVFVFDNDITGRNNGPGGDGGIDCYNSTNVSIFSNTSVNSGESAIYTAPNPMGCTGIAVWDNQVTGSNEWGIDLVDANGAFVHANTVISSNFGAMVLWDSTNADVQWNTFTNNNGSGVGTCQGLNKKGNTSGLIFANNVGNPTLQCIRP